MNTNSFTGSLARGDVAHKASAHERASGWRHDAVWLGVISLWVILALGLVYRTPQPLTVDIGSSYARAYLRGFDKPERNERYTYAFTRDQAQIFVPGAGGGVFDATLRFDATRPAGAPPALVRLNAAQTTLALQASAGLRSYHLLLPATNGDLDLRITSTTFRPGANDPRELGLPIESFAARTLTATPPLRMGLLVLALAVGLYALARRLALRVDVSALLVLVIVSSLIYGLFAARLLITVGLVRWLVVLLGLHVALWPLRPLVRTLYRRSAVPLTDAEETWLWRIFAAATFVKVGGILYPHAIIFDQAAHVSRMGWILDGRFMELYRPGYTSYMGDTVGLGGGQFPYSPLWYLVVLPFHFLGLGLADATNGLSALMDVSKLFPIHLIARVTLGSWRTALYAAALYHLLPMPYFLLSWGNYPTQFGLWAALLVTAFLVVHYERFATRRVFWMWVGLMVLAILSYTVLGAFTITLVTLIGIFGLLQRSGLGRKRLRFIVVGMIVAELFCFTIYHVQFAQAMVFDTLPAIVSGTADRLDNPLDAQAEARENALANIQANNQFTVGHFTPLVLLLTGLGSLLLLNDGRMRRWWPLWAAWLGIFVIYTLLSAYVADMVLKHVFFMMPLVCIWTAACLDRWWRRGWGGQLAVLTVLLFLAVDVMQRGHFYLLVKRHFV